LVQKPAHARGEWLPHVREHSSKKLLNRTTEGNNITLSLASY